MLKITIMEFQIKACKTKAACSVKPLRKTALNLEKIKSRFKTLVDTPILIVIEEQNHEIIVHSHGELLFKDLKDEKEITKIANKIYDILE